MKRAARVADVEFIRNQAHDNPFRPGATPTFVGGRVDERQEMLRWLDAATAVAVNGPDPSIQALLVAGPRGTGKTTLRSWFSEYVLEAGWHPLYLRGDLRSQGLVHALERDPNDRVVSADRQSTGMSVTANALAVSATWTHERKRDVAARNDLAALVGGIAFDADTHAGCMVIVDEAQALERDHVAELTAMLEGLGDGQGAPIAVVLLGTERLHATLNSNDGSFGRLLRGKWIDLPIRQALHDVSQIMAGTLQQVDRQIHEDAVEAVWAQTRGFPHAVQLYGRGAFGQLGAAGTITIEMVEAVTDDVDGDLASSVFRGMWNRQGRRGPQPTAARAHLTTLARSASPMTQADLAHAAGATPQSIAQTVKDLVNRGVLVRESDATLDFSMPSLQRFVLANS